MSRFTSLLTVSPLSDGKSWWLRTPFGYDVGREGSGDSVEVPVGFVTDFASIPRLFWILLPKWGRYGHAAVVHDFLYWQQQRRRREADSIFLEGMKVLSVSLLVRYVMFGAVWTFGWLSWLNNRWDRLAGINRVVDSGLTKVTDLPPARPGVLRHVIRGRPWA
jgi:hypothetical protein